MESPLRTVDRALAVIELLKVNPELTVSQVAGELGVGTSVAHRLLVALEARGFARHADASRAYRLGPSMFGLSPQSSDADYIAVAQDQVKALQAVTGETVHLAALHGRAVRFFYTAVSRHIMRVESRVGDLLLSHVSAAGRVLLAALSAREVRALYPTESLPGAGGATTPTRTDLEAELAAIRERGYARNVEESEAGVVALAAVVTPGGPAPAFSVTVAAPQARLQISRDDVNTDGERALSAELLRTVSVIQQRVLALKRR